MKKEKPIGNIKFRANDRIRANEVRLVGATGENIGVVPIEEAQQLARDADMDLVEVAPNAKPPVCKVMDLGKFLYEQEKKRQKARKSQKIVEVKEIRLRPKTTDHHANFKVRDARRWLESKKKVNVRVQFRGREVHYPEIAFKMLQDIADELSDVGVVEQRPSREGYSMLMVIAPAKE
ncbi:MAG: translation initiation factor IF-3 [Chloroflexota bacterium]|nr:MAG: translation initiation factor IF-3 [Chloroflexota bacterium]